MTLDELFEQWITSDTELTYSEWLVERGKKKEDIMILINNYAVNRTGVNDIRIGHRQWKEEYETPISNSN